MKRLLSYGAALLFWLISTTTLALPPEEEAYQRARAEASECSPAERVEIWSRYLAEHPDSPYRTQARAELEAAAQGLGPRADEPLGALLDDTIPRHRDIDPKATSRAVLAAFGATLGGTALGLALLETGAPPALGASVAVAALTFGPSAGHLYAGDRERARRRSFARVASAAAFTAPLVLVDQGSLSREAALAISSAAAVSYVALIGADLADSFFVVRRAAR